MDNIDRIYSILRHELGNSVNSLTITLEVLLKNYELFNDETRIEFISRSLDQVNRQYRILESMRLYQSADIRELTQVRLPGFIETATRVFKDNLSSTGITMTLRMKGRPSVIMADVEGLTQTFNSFLDNAMAALQSRENPEISIFYTCDAKNAIITITDNGEGMTDEVLKKVEVPLFSTRENRMGLGVSIALKMISKMGGTMDIASERSSGTTVTICFPIIK
jgi:signal transduction histidine kinase